MKLLVFFLLLGAFALPVAGGIWLPVHGLVIGNANYMNAYELEFPVLDAQFFYNSLVQCGFVSPLSQDSVVLLKDATLSDTLRALFNLVDHVLQETACWSLEQQTVVIYYAGYCMSARKKGAEIGAIAPIEVTPKEENKHCVGEDILNAFLDLIAPARIVIILDCSEMGNDGLAGPNRTILAASSRDGEAWEDRALGHGVFTYFLLKGLQEGDQDGDEEVSLQEAFNYARGRTAAYVKGRFGRTQEPEMTDGIGQPIFLFDDPTKCPGGSDMGESDRVLSE